MPATTNPSAMTLPIRLQTEVSNHAVRTVCDASDCSEPDIYPLDHRDRDADIDRTFSRLWWLGAASYITALNLSQNGAEVLAMDDAGVLDDGDPSLPVLTVRNNDDDIWRIAVMITAADGSIPDYLSSGLARLADSGTALAEVRLPRAWAIQPMDCVHDGLGWVHGFAVDIPGPRTADLPWSAA